MRHHRSAALLIAGIALGTVLGYHASAHAGTNACAPTGLPPSGHHVLLSVTGGAAEQQPTDTNTFTTKGAFTVRYAGQQLNTGAYSIGALFGIEIKSLDGQLDDLVVGPSLVPASEPRPSGTLYVRGDDCSKGCYLEITSSNLRYGIQVTQ